MEKLNEIMLLTNDKLFFAGSSKILEYRYSLEDEFLRINKVNKITDFDTKKYFSQLFRLGMVYQTSYED